jgi:hypothetical protein
LTQLYRWFPSILQVLTIIRPETLVRWHRAGFRCYWRWKSRPLGGRPRIDTELRVLIRRMSVENPLWGAPRVHGEPQASCKSIASPHQFNRRIAVTANAYRGQHPEQRDRCGDLCNLHRIERATPFRNTNISDSDFRDVPRRHHATALARALRRSIEEIGIGSS